MKNNSEKSKQLSPLLYCQCLQASLFVYAILWLYSISICDGSRSQQKKPNKKVNESFPRNLEKLPVCSSISCDGIFFKSWCCTLLPLLLYRFVPLRYYIVISFYFSKVV
jgi:hypothetical protein